MRSRELSITAEQAVVQDSLWFSGALPTHWMAVSEPRQQWQSVAPGELNPAITRRLASLEQEHCAFSLGEVRVLGAESQDPTRLSSDVVRAGLAALLGETGSWQYDLAAQMAEQAVALRLADFEHILEERVSAAVERVLAERLKSSDDRTLEARLRPILENVEAKAAAVDVMPVEDAVSYVDITSLFDE